MSMYMQRNPLGVGVEWVSSDTALAVTASTDLAASRVVQNGLLDLGTTTFPTTALDGTSYINKAVNNVAEIEVPYYSNYRFSPGKESSYTGVETFDATWRYSILAHNTIVLNVDEWYSTGEDFQVYMWNGLPRMYYEATVPAA